MQVIYKYEIKIQPLQVLKLPIRAQILDIQIQNGSVQLWAIVAKDVKETVDVTIEIFGTGHEMPEGNRQYITTFQQGPYVWHAFIQIPVVGLKVSVVK